MMAAPVTELVQGRPVPIDRFEISLRPRDLDEIVNGAVEGTLAADAEVGAGRVDQRFGVRQDETLGNRRGNCRQPFRQVFALVGVEDREAFQERYRIRLVPAAVRPPAVPSWPC